MLVNKRWGVCTLLILVIFGTGLRLWNISQAKNVDESNIITRAVRVADWHFHIRWYNWPAQSLIRMDAVPFFFYTKWYEISHQTHISTEHLYQQHPKPFTTIAHLMTTGFAALSLFLIFFIGQRVQGNALGLLSTFFLSINYLHSLHSRFATPDIPLTTAFLASLWLAILIYQLPWEQGKRNIKTILALLFASGSVVGFALATKYTGLLAVIPFFLVAVLKWRFFLRRTKEWKVILAGLGIWTLGFLIFHTAYNPFAITDWKLIWNDLLFESSPTRIGVDFGGQDYVFFRNLWFYLKGSFVWNGTLISVIAYLTALVSVLGFKSSKWKLPLLISSFYLITLLSLSHLGLHWSRWALPFSVLTPLLASFGVLAIYHRLLNRFSPWVIKSVLTIVLLVATVPQLYISAAEARSLSASGLPKAMSQEIQLLVPQGSKIATDSYFIRSNQHDILQYQFHLYQNSVDSYLNKGIHYFVVKTGREKLAKNQPQLYIHVLDFFEQLKNQGEVLATVPTKECENVLNHKRDYKVWAWIFEHGFEAGGFCQGDQLKLYVM